MALRLPVLPLVNVLASTLLAAVPMLHASGACAGELRPAQSADDLSNPHRGFLLWGTSVVADGGLPVNHYGASIYQIYMPWREIETADEQFDWDGFERRHLQPIQDQHPQATFVLRPVADYPDGGASHIDHFYDRAEGEPERDYPKFLELPPLRIAGRDYTDCGGNGPGRAPDYNSPAMHRQLLQFVRAFGQRYDGDPRITAVHVGLLGFWGEWHTSGCVAWEPDASTREQVRDAYLAAFARTPVHTRYARASDIAGTGFGISEDYFPSFTAMCDRFDPPLPHCDDSGWWSLEWSYRRLPSAREHWKLNPIGGESPLPEQQNAWTGRNAEILALIGDYRLTWLGPAGLHEVDPRGKPAAFKDAMVRIERALGYEFTVREVAWPDTMRAGAAIALRLALQNTGSAPLYHAYRTELHWVDAAGATRARAAFDYPLNALLPGTVAKPVDAGATVPATLAPGRYSPRLAIADAAPGRRGIAPQNAGRDRQGRLPLGTVTVAAP